MEVWCTQAFLAAAKAESSASVRKALAQTVAQLAAHAPEARAAKLFAEVADMYRQGELWTAGRCQLLLQPRHACCCLVLWTQARAPATGLHVAQEAVLHLIMS